MAHATIVDESVKTSNVKAHFAVTVTESFEENLLSQAGVKKHSNFYTVRPHAEYVYTVFPKSGHVNVSGIKSFESVGAATNHFLQSLCVSVCSPIQCDNSTTSGKLSRPVALFKFDELARREKNLPFSVSIRPHFFPAVLLRSKNTSNKSEGNEDQTGSIIIFSNGKFVIVGCKSHSAIEWTKEKLSSILVDLDTGK